ncbi:MAG TPA: hydroxymethylglutaryl-CoA lyase [Anaerolineae bacterium]|nr:hydroxymethylglutaryl-CoA lyase [Anaerolineae bacterium]
MAITQSTWEEMLPKRVEIIEVGPRDGFQILQDFIDTQDKIHVIDSLIEAGIRRMEVTSFVHPKFVPQMRDAADVLRGIKRGGCQCFAMAPNLKGAERAIEAGADMLNLVVSASDSHNRSNVRRSVEESLAGFPSVLELAVQAKIPVRASLATVFGCPFEGDVPIERVLHVCRRFVDMGCVELNLCDTTGMANPRQVAAVAQRVLGEFPGVRIVLHFHNTRGAGAANLLSAMQNGITSFEASFGGLGGCPFAPGATGNVCTEDMVHMLHGMGVDTGIDLEALLSAVRDAERILGMTFPGQVIRAGRDCDLHALPST